MSKLNKEPEYEITNATYSMKLGYAISGQLWNSFEHSLSVNLKPGADINKINEEMWERVILEVENKIEESQKLYKN